jgi:hypothetical protein
MAMGGIGEAALLEALIGGAQMGAAVGGGKALLTGEDPLKGALMGGLMGGATGGMMNALAPGAAAAAPAGADAVSSALPEAIGTNALQNSQLYTANPDFNPMANTAGFGGPGTSMLGSNPSVQYAISDMPATIPGAGAPGSAGSGMGDWWNSLSDKQKILTGGAGVMGLGMISDRNRYGVPKQDPYTGALSRFRFNPETYRARPYAEGGITSLQAGGYDRMVGEDPMYSAMASGGIANLGGYSDGGRMLKGPGDGMSDSIPATIAGKRPARLATEEFVVPADVVSHLGNGSSDAGAKQLYAMMDKVRKARTGTKRQGREINPDKYMPKYA